MGKQDLDKGGLDFARVICPGDHGGAAQKNTASALKNRLSDLMFGEPGHITG